LVKVQAPVSQNKEWPLLAEQVTASPFFKDISLTHFPVPETRLQAEFKAQSKSFSQPSWPALIKLEQYFVLLQWRPKLQSWVRVQLLPCANPTQKPDVQTPEIQAEFDEQAEPGYSPEAAGGASQETLAYLLLAK
jgi:hypothetical protein